MKKAIYNLFLCFAAVMAGTFFCGGDLVGAIQKNMEEKVEFENTLRKTLVMYLLKIQEMGNSQSSCYRECLRLYNQDLYNIVTKNFTGNSEEFHSVYKNVRELFAPLLTEDKDGTIYEKEIKPLLNGFFKESCGSEVKE